MMHFLLLTHQSHQCRSLAGGHQEIKGHPYTKWPQSKEVSVFNSQPMDWNMAIYI